MSSMTKRQADNDQNDRAYRRAETRKARRGDEWFFSSREGEHGPYTSEAEADEELEAYVGLIDLQAENESPVKLDD
jgi:hypothetical protein